MHVWDAHVLNMHVLTYCVNGPLTDSVWHKSCRASVRGCLQIFVVTFSDSRFFYSDPWIFKKLGENAPTDPIENSQDKAISSSCFSYNATTWKCSLIRSPVSKQKWYEKDPHPPPPPCSKTVIAEINRPIFCSSMTSPYEWNPSRGDIKHRRKTTSQCTALLLGWCYIRTPDRGCRRWILSSIQTNNISPSISVLYTVHLLCATCTNCTLEELLLPTTMMTTKNNDVDL